MGQRHLNQAVCKKHVLESREHGQVPRSRLDGGVASQASGPMDIDHGCCDQVQLQLLLLRHDVLVNLICLALALPAIPAWDVEDPRSISEFYCTIEASNVAGL